MKSVVIKKTNPFSLLNIPNFHLLPYQAALVRYLLRQDVVRFIAGWKMGLGKTILAIAFAESHFSRCYNEGKNLPPSTTTPIYCIVIAPPTLQQNMKNALRTKFHRTDSHIERFYHFWSTDAAAKRHDEFTRDCANQLVFIDEFHFLRTEITYAQNNTQEASSGRRAVKIFAALESAWKILAVTGTPLINRMSDIWNASKMLLGGRKGSKQDIEIFLEHVKLSQLKKNILSEEALAIIRAAWTGRFSYQDAVTANLQDKMPHCTEINVLIEMNPEYFQAYSQVELHELEKLKERQETIRGDEPFCSGLRRAANHTPNVPSQKVAFSIELIRRAKRQKKRVVLTSAYLERGLEPFEAPFRKKKIACRIITGTVPDTARQVAVNAFNDSKQNVDVILLSSAGMTGTDLNKSEIQVNMESPWNEATRRQMNSRSVRLYSTSKSVTVYNLFLCKRNRFHEEVKQMEKDVEEKIPGAPDMVWAIPWTPKNPQNEKTDDTLTRAMETLSLGDTEPKPFPSIDIRLYETQCKKSQALLPLQQLLESLSVDRHEKWSSLFTTQTLQ